ncbi:hypothetical protein BST61_g7753 [Cercospora zeina]
MAIQGRTLLEAILEALKFSTKYCRGIKEYNAREEVRQQIKTVAENAKSAGQLDKDLSARQTALRTLQQSIPDIKYAIYVRFIEALLSYTYRAGLAKMPSTIRIAADMDANNLNTALGELRSALLDDAGKFGSEVEVGDQGATVITTEMPGTFPKNWRRTLRHDGFLPFRVLPESMALKNYYRCRITDMWATFIDSTTGVEKQPIGYQIHVGPHFLDKTDDNKELLHFYQKPYVLPKIGREGKWTDESKNAYARPAVLCTGELALADPYRSWVEDVAWISISTKFIKGQPVMLKRGS